MRHRRGAEARDRARRAFLQGELTGRWRKEEREENPNTVCAPVVVNGEKAPCGKVGFVSKREADKNLNRLLLKRARERQSGFEMRSYRCDKAECVELEADVWHCTSRKR